jgi:murein L,D-transpeptidase YcbB/YkuD
MGKTRKRTLISLITGCLFLSSIWHTGTTSEQSSSSQIQELLRNRIESAGIPPQIFIGTESVYASVALPLFYSQRIFQPVWVDEEGYLSHAEELLFSIRDARLEGLNPLDYHLEKIEAFFKLLDESNKASRVPSPRLLVDLELLLTDAFLVYGSHLVSGKVNPEIIDPEWIASRREVDLVLRLESAVQSRQMAETLKNLLPEQPGYYRLKSALARYRELEKRGGWSAISLGPKLQLGDRNERVAALRERLIITGDLEAEESVEMDFFDEEIEKAVLRFQARHGLDRDGVVGPKSLGALNVPAGERVKQIELNMERWRWLPQDLGARYILVNIANFELDVLENGDRVLSMKSITGRDYRRTPVFSANMTYLVLNPYWHIPPRIAIKDKLPLIKKDVSYLEKQKIKVFEGWGAETREIDPATIDWEMVTAGNFNFRLRQDPGPQNALGQVKFMFPNKFNVYIHDTPSRELFAQAERALSSGCIRVQYPIDLAVYVLRDDSKWTRQDITDAIAKGVENTVSLPLPILVHLLYWTAWADEKDTVHFRPDIYGRDQTLWEALNEESPDQLKIQKKEP